MQWGGPIYSHQNLLTEANSNSASVKSVPAGDPHSSQSVEGASIILDT